MNSNLNRIGFEIYLNNSKEKWKIHYFIEPHCSPWSQWHTGLWPNTLAQGGSFWQPVPTGHAPSASRVCAARGHHGWSDGHGMALIGASERQ
jgi:hypothetical protein